MKIHIQQEIPSILILTALLCILSICMGNALKKFDEKDPLAKPEGLAFLALWLVETIDGLVAQSMSEKVVKSYGPYIGSLAMYMLCANLSGLFGFKTPTMNLSINLALAGVTWLLIQAAGIKTNGLGGYIHGLFEPMPFFVFGNVISKFSPLVSLSMRLFGNILSGSILMSLVYTATGLASDILLSWTGLSFNIVGIIIAPILHCYFDVFSGCIQMYIFVSLTMAFVNSELGD